MKIATHLGIALVCAEALLVTAATAQLPDPLETWITPPGTGTFVQFGGPSVPPIPADFFGPGSDPFQGQVDFIGVEIDPPNLGSTSTLIQRSADPFLPADLPAGPPVTIDIEIVALSLRSASPITVTFNGGQNPEPWDLEVELSGVTPPLGTMTVTKTHLNGGTFDADFFVQPLFTFTQLVFPFNVLGIDTGLEGIRPNLLNIAGARWVHKVNPALGVIVQPGAIFVPGVDEVTPGDQNSQVQSPFEGIDPGGVQHTVCAPKGQPPLNNNLCIERRPIFNGKTPFDNIGASFDGPIAPGGLHCVGTMTSDVWWNYTADVTGTVNVDTCQSTGIPTDDTTLVVYDGCDCATIHCGIDGLPGGVLAQDDDSCKAPGGGSAFLSSVKIPVVAGNCYKIQVGGFAIGGVDPGTQGSGIITITKQGDACCLWDGSCVDGTTPASCAALAGVFQGDGSVCAPAPGGVVCPLPPTGANFFTDPAAFENALPPDKRAKASWNFKPNKQAPGTGVVLDDPLNINTHFQDPDSPWFNPPPPNNGACADRRPIFNGKTPFDNTGSILDGPTCDLNMDTDVWWNYQADFSGTLTVDTCQDANGTLQDTVLTVYHGCDCATLGCLPAGNELASDDDSCGVLGFSSIVSVPVVAGNCYKIQVGGWNGATGSGIVTLSKAPPVLNNNLCIERRVISNGKTPFDSTGATTDGPSAGPACTGGPGPTNDVWWNYTPDFTGDVTITTCEELNGSATFDTVLAVYKGCVCPVGPAIACNDDDPVNPCGAAGGGFHSTLQFPVVAGNCYKIQLGGFAGDSGPGVLSINKSLPAGADAGGRPALGAFGERRAASSGQDGGISGGPGNTGVNLWPPSMDNVTFQSNVGPNPQPPIPNPRGVDGLVFANNLLNYDNNILIANIFVDSFDILSGPPTGGPPPSGNCCFTHPGPGCEDSFCSVNVCAIDFSCCVPGPWDAACVAIANSIPECDCDPIPPDNHTAMSIEIVTAPAPGGVLGPVLVTVYDKSDVPVGKIKVDIFQNPPCELACPAGATLEPEVCGAQTNNGCNSVPPAFGTIACGETICGTAWADGDTRDTDWYIINLPDSDGDGFEQITATLFSQFPGVCFILSGPPSDCANIVSVGTTGCSDNCANISTATACLPAPATYTIFVAAGNCNGSGIFDGFPCGTQNDYTLEVTCGPTCVPGPGAAGDRKASNGGAGAKAVVNTATHGGSEAAAARKAAKVGALTDQAGRGAGGVAGGAVKKTFLGIIMKPPLTIGRVNLSDLGGGSEGISKITVYGNFPGITQTDIAGPLGPGIPDGCVDAIDLALLLNNWCSAAGDPDPAGDVDPPCECTPGPFFTLVDISGPDGAPDGCVDANDLAKLLNDWCSVAGLNPCGTCFP